MRLYPHAQEQPARRPSCAAFSFTAAGAWGKARESSLKVAQASFFLPIDDSDIPSLSKVSGAFGGNIRGKSIAVLGVTFKPNTDDMRDSPSLPLITALQDMGAKVRAFDPIGMEQAKPMMSNVTFCEDAYSCAEGASALVIVTEWEQFRALDFKRLKSIMARPVLVDLRNIYRSEEVLRHGFSYESIGRARVDTPENLTRRASDRK